MLHLGVFEIENHVVIIDEWNFKKSERKKEQSQSGVYGDKGVGVWEGGGGTSSLNGVVSFTISAGFADASAS